MHVVHYSEAIRMAKPPIIKDSIKITLSALSEYRKARSLGTIPNMRFDMETTDLTDALYDECKQSIEILEKSIPNLYTPEGFYKIFVEGFLPVPYLLDTKHKFPKATQWRTAIKDGGIRVVDEKGNVIFTPNRYRRILDSIS